MAGLSLRLFQKRLAETIAYCQPRLNPADVKNCFRTSPLPNFKIFPTYELKDIAHFAVTVEHKRRREMQGSSDSVPLPAGLAGGRLLITHLNMTTCDGIAPVDTNGYIDECDVPAWDTWVYWGRDYRSHRADTWDYLISWVPGVLHLRVHNAICASAFESITWLEDTEVYRLTFFNALKQAGYFWKTES